MLHILGQTYRNKIKQNKLITWTNWNEIIIKPQHYVINTDVFVVSVNLTV